MGLNYSGIENWPALGEGHGILITPGKPSSTTYYRSYYFGICCTLWWGRVTLNIICSLFIVNLTL